MKIGTFTAIFTIYMLGSFVIYALGAFTIAAWIFYLPILIPTYLLGLAHLLSLSFKYRHQSIGYRKFLLYPIAIFQLLTILSSPASCYGFKQGRACYSFLQSLFASPSSFPIETDLSHWSFLEFLFPVALFLYVISLMLFLGLIRVKR